MSDAFDRIRNTVEKNKIVIFMKGNRHFPQCGFSAATIEVFETLGVPYETVDVLQDPEIREGVKQFTKWPTIPQVFVNGKFVGGCDIVREMYDSGELRPMVQEAIASWALSFAEIDRSLLGQEFDRAAYGPITSEELISYAGKLGETDAIYLDAEAARARGGLVAHPTFVVKLRGDRALPQFVVAQMRSGGFDAGKDIEFGAAIRPGDVLQVKSSVHDIYEKTGRSGSMVFLVLRTEIRNQRGEMVAIVDQRMMQKA